MAGGAVMIPPKLFPQKFRTDFSQHSSAMIGELQQINVKFLFKK
jgi:hypothetical protein